MQNKMKLGAASITLAVLMSGCAPMASTTPQASATGDYNTGGSYNTSYNTTGTAGTYDTAALPNYDYSSGSAPTGTTAPSYSSGYDNYYAGSTGSSGGSYYDSGSSGGSTGSATGSHAVQVLASPNIGTAESMLNQMRSAGFTAVIDNVGGYYKVRVPYGSASEAKASLGRIRSIAPDAWYTPR
ncbi:SPOR domain-containing protein [Candidatus Thiothrix anitrata]|jgi:hypothetical protein|uniref:SPOR domain-containing protein n=1 Tax=Candidatus Thiothrix anitrata TaxID=2823902 RepID=A0ABX7X035_9GAMM|nr:SPOR domain-containing protein [Candidatus Thiothrix anitrata]QTR49026.1 SPOR domain-containing protein [Candidatus Thiothrix anitrata]